MPDTRASCDLLLVHDRRWLALGAALAFLGVALGAFGAHALRARVEPDLLAVWKTGVEYQLYHALALGILSVVALPERITRAVGALFLAGVVLFSGSLYVLVLSGVRTFGMITPIGGVCFLVGWAVLAAGALRR